MPIGDSDNISTSSLAIQNCVIENNVCGAIGYWGTKDVRYNNISTNITTTNNKDFDLVIRGNKCNIILNMSSVGFEYSVLRYSLGGAFTETASIDSVSTLISNNKVGFIFVGTSNSNRAGINISDNELTAVDSSYVNLYTDDESSNKNYFLKRLNYAISVQGNNIGTSSRAKEGVIISNNIIQTANFNGTELGYVYGGIWAQCSAKITNNIFNGYKSDDEGHTGLIPIRLSNGNQYIVTHNSLYRNSTKIGCYIGYDFLFNATRFPDSSWFGAGSKGIITENIFDSPYNSGTSTNTIDLNVNETMSSDSQWIVERNINQTAYITLTSAEGEHLYTFTGSEYYYWNNDVGIDISVNAYSSISTTDNLPYHTVFFRAGHSSDPNIPYKIRFNISNMIPKEVKIVNASVTYVPSEPIYSITANQYVGYIYVMPPNELPVSTYVDFNTLAEYDLDNIISLNLSNVYNTGYNSTTSGIIIECRLKFTGTSSNTANVKVKNITVTYRW